jgi:hypothetical protein
MRWILFTNPESPGGRIIVGRLRDAGLPPSAVVAEALRPEPFGQRLSRVVAVSGLGGLMAVVGRRAFRRLGLPGGRRGGETLRDLCHTAGVPYHEVASLNTDEGRGLAADCAPQLGVVCGTRILRPPVFGVPRLGCVNLHTSLLPKYRGRASIFWALYHGDPVGVSIHVVDEALDAGAVLRQAAVKVGPTDGGEEVLRRCLSAGAELVLEVVRHAAERGALPPRILAAGGPGPLYRVPSRAEVRDFLRHRPMRGVEFIAY